MGVDPIKVVKVVLVIIKHTMWVLGIGIGIEALTSISSGAVGFKFFGIVTLLIGIALLILFCVDCATFDNHEEVFVCESICCGVPLYLLMVAFGIFALAVTSHGSGKSLPGIAYKEYELTSYSKWMQNKVNDTYRWNTYYKSTLIKHHVCSDMLDEFRLDTLDAFHQRSLNSFEPPEECNMKYTNPTVWEKPKNQNFSNIDCYAWSNDPNIFCFNCQSCKAAFAQDVKKHWFFSGVVIVVVATKLFLLIIGLVLCFRFNPTTKT